MGAKPGGRGHRGRKEGVTSQPPPIGTWLRPVTWFRARYCYQLVRVIGPDETGDSDQWWLTTHDYHPGRAPGPVRGGCAMPGSGYPPCVYISDIRRVRPGVWRQDTCGYEGRTIGGIEPYLVAFQPVGDGGQMGLL